MILSSKLVLTIGALAVATLGGFSVGCGAHVGQLKEAAAADLGCSPGLVHVLNSGKTRDVEACGQRATYRWEDGDWRMIGRSGAPPAGGPPPVMRSSPNGGGQQPVMAPGQPMGTPTQPPPSSPPPGGKSL